MSLEGKQLGRYHLLNLIGSGNMGEVYLAEDLQLHRQVALKVTRAEAPAYPDSQARAEAARLFQREARAIAMLDHPHILPLFDYGEEQVSGTSLTYMVMPLRQEGSLPTWLQKYSGSGLLSPQEVVYFIRQAAQALQHAHDHEITHQDVKPSNFLIRENKEDPQYPDLLLADFGVAKFSRATIGTSRTIRGTPAYMAPEQWEGHPVPATDQYGLAVMTYELLTGHVPFQGSMQQVMYQHFQAQPRPPSELNPRLPPQVDEVLLRALAKRPEDRFASVTAFARALQGAILEDWATNAATFIKTPAPPPSPPTTISSPSTVARVSPATSAFPTASAQLPLIVERSRPPRSFPKGMIVLLITLALFIGAGSTALLFATSARQNQGPQTNTLIQGQTPTPRQTDRAATAQENTTSTVQVNATATAQENAASTAQANATAQATLPSNSYTQGGTLVLNDPLSDNSQGYNWMENTTSYGSCSFMGGAYHASSPTSPYYHACAAQGTNFSNFAYEVDLTIIAGNCGGIIFRGEMSVKHYYFFRICQNGSYDLLIYAGSGYAVQTLVQCDPPCSNPRIHAGLNQPNVIAVVAKNDSLALYVNHQFITSLHDSTYSQGQIGVVADNDDSPTEVVFSNAKVWTL